MGGCLGPTSEEKMNCKIAEGNFQGGGSVLYLHYGSSFVSEYNYQTHRIIYTKGIPFIIYVTP